MNNKELFHFIKATSAYETALKDIKDRMEGKILPISTGWQSVDDTYFDGLERGWIVSISGPSGTGKTAFMAQMVDQIIASNDYQMAYLIFSFEMRPDRLMKRMICREHGVTMDDLYSLKRGKKITQKKFDGFKSNNIPLIGQPSSFVERPLNHIDIAGHINYFRKQLISKGYPPEMPLLVVIDHLLLAKNGTGKSGIDDVMLMENEMKKIDPNIVFLNITQLNRNYDSVERHDPDKPGKHYPVKSDLYGSDMIWMTSDSIIVLTNPSNVGLDYYGMDNLFTTTSDGRPYVFAHHLKNRDAKGGRVTPFIYTGKHFLFEETEVDAKEEEDILDDPSDDGIPY